MSLEDLRKRIDEIDRKLVELLNERAKVVIEIGKLKNKTGKPVYAPDREKEVLEKVTGANKGPLPNKCLQAIWRELMSGSFVLERPLRIALSGTGRQFQPYGRDAEVRPERRVRAADGYSRRSSTRSARDTAIWVLVPIENTSGGGVSRDRSMP